MLEWHFVIKGPIDTPYRGGSYHGKLIFPSEYPYKPPAIMMLTPNGRFATNTRLCLSMSDFHPETWVPAWSVASILNGVLSFMLESTPTVGSVDASEEERKRLALASHAWNRKSSLFCELFPDLVVPASEVESTSASAAAVDEKSLAARLGGIQLLLLGVTALAAVCLAHLVQQL